MKKAPGFSMIELDGVVNEFIAGGRAHPQAQEIYAKVDEVLEQVRKVGYVPDTDGVVHDIEEEEEEREKPLYYHSEKLAIGFGLLKTKPGETLRITKNLRVCKDCHTVSKLLSKLFDREIIVRDRSGSTILEGESVLARITGNVNVPRNCAWLLSALVCDMASDLVLDN